MSRKTAYIAGHDGLHATSMKCALGMVQAGEAYQVQENPLVVQPLKNSLFNDELRSAQGRALSGVTLLGWNGALCHHNGHARVRPKGEQISVEETEFRDYKKAHRPIDGLIIALQIMEARKSRRGQAS